MARSGNRLIPNHLLPRERDCRVSPIAYDDYYANHRPLVTVEKSHFSNRGRRCKNVAKKSNISIKSICSSNSNVTKSSEGRLSISGSDSTECGSVETPVEFYDSRIESDSKYDSSSSQFEQKISDSIMPSLNDNSKLYFEKESHVFQNHEISFQNQQVKGSDNFERRQRETKTKDTFLQESCSEKAEKTSFKTRTAAVTSFCNRKSKMEDKMKEELLLSLSAMTLQNAYFLQNLKKCILEVDQNLDKSRSNLDITTSKITLKENLLREYANDMKSKSALINFSSEENLFQRLTKSQAKDNINGIKDAKKVQNHSSNYRCKTHKLQTSSLDENKKVSKNRKAAKWRKDQNRQSFTEMAIVAPSESKVSSNDIKLSRNNQAKISHGDINTIQARRSCKREEHKCQPLFPENCLTEIASLNKEMRCYGYVLILLKTG